MDFSSVYFDMFEAMLNTTQKNYFEGLTRRIVKCKSTMVLFTTLIILSDII